jgi:hypothetical protein
VDGKTDRREHNVGWVEAAQALCGRLGLALGMGMGARQWERRGDEWRGAGYGALLLT